MKASEYSLNRTTGPSAEPASLAEARDQCEIASGVTAHDTKLTRYIAAAREKVETDTEYVCITQTFTLSFRDFPDGEEPIYLPVRPVGSVSGITYYDTDNSQQTLATTVYGVDASRRMVYLKYDQEWPDVTDQHNGCVITFTAGFGASSANVPALIRQMVLVEVARWWAVDRGDRIGEMEQKTEYDELVKRIRSARHIA